MDRISGGGAGKEGIMKKKWIVTTTISEPTEATLKFAAMPDWQLVVVGDTKTPHESYRSLAGVIYLSPEDQEAISKELSDAIGWRSIRRRNFGFIYAYQNGAEVIATVDDDNIPYEGWGENLLVGKTVEVDTYDDALGVFDPISVTEHSNIWHRGFPVQFVPNRAPVYQGKRVINCMVQADFWDGDPDVDALCRLSIAPQVKFQKFQPFAPISITPFNSQNTFLHRDVIPFYMMIPHIGRMDDIWGAYMLQQELGMDHPPFICFCPASVYQDRNDHDLVIDLEQEIVGYRHNPAVLSEGVYKYLPPESQKAWNLYRAQFG